MTDITLATTDLELVTIVINTGLLIALGLVMIFAKQAEQMGARLLGLWNKSQFRRPGASTFPTFGLRGHS